MSKFLHFLSYGSTDQETARSLTGYFDGLMVPGTVAAFQAEGTKGFILSLSARSKERYAIDSRFPLFQNRLSSWKKSHLLLARIFGFEELLQRQQTLNPADFTEELIARIARGWIEFNIGFEDVKMKTFDKYAARLPEDKILVQDRESPYWILPPYLMIDSPTSRWNAVSDAIWDKTVDLLKGKPEVNKLRRVIAAESPETWDNLLRSSDQTEVVGWVSSLDELGLTHPEQQQLVAYGRAIKSSTQRGQRIFALYGGFFSVLLSRFGLLGSSHGVGYGEYRNHIELPTSGAPPARYYVPRLHRYIGVDIADVLWNEAKDLIRCDCDECSGRSPVELDYHELMRHSVRVRKDEIDSWPLKSTVDVCRELREDHDSYKSAMENLSAPSGILKRCRGIYPHLANWASALEQIEV